MGVGSRDAIIISMMRLYLTVFLLSCSVLIFEISLTRIFSITLWYHFAFMVISIAMLGIGSAGTVLSLCACSGNRPEDREQDLSGSRMKISGFICSLRGLPLFSLMTGIAILVCYIVSNSIPFDPARFAWDRLQPVYLFFYCLLLSIPFLFSGIVIAAAFTLFSARSLPVYAADLIGAGTGSLLVIVILNMAAPEYAVITASSLSLAAALLLGDRKIAAAAVFFLLVNLLLSLYHPDLLLLKMSPYKNLSVYLQYPGAKTLRTYNSSFSRIDVFKSPGIRYAPGLSLTYSEALPDQTGLATDGQRIDVISSAGDPRKMKFVTFLPDALAFELSRKENALILDPRGGLHASMAEYYGFQKIMKVESDPHFLRVARDDFTGYAGGIYTFNTSGGFGRNYLKSGKPSGDVRYDLIDIPMTGASVAGTFGIAEEYRYTVNAFRQYLEHLDHDGIISTSLYLVPPYRTEFRLLSTIVAAGEQSGISDTASAIAAIRSWDVLTILAKKTSFSAGDIDRIKKFADSRNFDLVYYPGIKMSETNRFIKTASNDLVNGFRSIIDPESRDSFIEHYIFDINPVFDRNPFFYYFFKAENIKGIYELASHKLLYFLNEGYLLPVILCIEALLSCFIILLPVALTARRRRYDRDPRLSAPVSHGPVLASLAYFGMLGIGFMFVEVPLIQTSIIAIENPTYCAAIVITVMLASAGTGSMFGSKFQFLQSSRSLIVLAVLLGVYALLQPYLIDRMTVYEPFLRVLILSASIIPIGFFMGLPFPLGIRLLGSSRPLLVPWAWAVNACCSVIAPLASVMIALVSGFHTVLWISVLAYLCAFAAMIRLRQYSS